LLPGVWTHGDLIRINPDTKGIYVLGRSDGVLNPSGVRFGTSDLYNILASPNLSSKVFDGLAVGQQRQTSKYSDPAERVILFLKVAPKHTSGNVSPLTELVHDIRQHIIKELSRRHVPHFFFEVEEIPHNANGKKMEIQVKQVCNGGQSALDKMTLTELERSMLQKFVRFHDVENFAEAQRKAKL
jgi:acetoacetyl-CoA synthetase